MQKTEEMRKVVSRRQEKMIADYLSWNTVPGSGSRGTRPGDIHSDEWLGECKTHVTAQPTIIFLFSYWEKIREEATAKFLLPALFVDRGHQTLDDVWVLFKNTFDDVTVTSEHIKVNNRSVSFDPKLLNSSSMYEIDPTGLAVASLSYFKSHVCIGG